MRWLAGIALIVVGIYVIAAVPAIAIIGLAWPVGFSPGEEAYLMFTSPILLLADKMHQTGLPLEVVQLVVLAAGVVIVISGVAILLRHFDPDTAVDSPREAPPATN